jgi:citrate synthase
MVVALATRVAPDRIEIDGEPIGEFIRRGDPAEMWFRMIQGRTPSQEESAVFGAILCSMADHGDTPPSTQAARLVASSGSPMQCSLAAALLAFGDHHAGAIERAMELFSSCVRDREIPSAVADRFISRGRRVPGFGHRVHREDPRVRPLVEVGSALTHRPHLSFFLGMQDHLRSAKGILGNVDGVCGALLLDLGFPPSAGRAVFFCGRIPGLVSWILREGELGPFRPYRLVPSEEVAPCIA